MIRTSKLSRPLAALAVAIVAALTPTARAGQTIRFDPLGGGGVSQTTTIQTAQFTWAPGNSVAVGAVPLQVGKSFTLLYQALLGGISGTTLAGGGVSVVQEQTDTTPPNSGEIIAGTTFTGREVTIAAQFQEVITGINTVDGQTTVTFSLSPTGPNNVSIYSAPAGTAKNLAGTGFTNTSLTGGTPILTGHVVQTGIEGTFASTFTFPTTGQGSPSSPVLFDQYGSDYPGGAPTLNGTGGPYPGVFTLSGTGTSFVPVQVDTANAAYFPNLTPANIFQLTFGSVSATTPFNAVSPSRQFFTGVNPVLGTVNGVNGRDFQFQTQAANDFVAAVPEPATLSMAVSGLGLLGLVGLRARRRQG